MLVHTVFFNFTETSSEADIQSCPADTEARPVSVRDFDLCLTVIFDSIADHDVYQVHTLHDDFIANNKDNWAKVRVHDAD